MDITSISKTASAVAAQHGELTQAIAEEQAAEAAVLVAVIEATRPALRALCSRLSSSHRSSGRGTDKEREATEYHDERGLCLAGTPQKDAPRDNSGAYEGEGLWLLSDGTLAHRAFAGSWSHWQGSGASWESTLTPITPETAMTSWKLDDCVRAITDALDGQLKGKAAERSKAARERATRLRAVLALI